MKPDNIKIIPQWSKSKEDIWNEAFASLKDTPSSIKTGISHFGNMQPCSLLPLS